MEGTAPVTLVFKSQQSGAGLMVTRTLIMSGPSEMGDRCPLPIFSTLWFPLGAQGGGQLELAGWEQKRTNSIVAWLEKHLTHLELCDLYKSEIDQWRSLYTVEQSEKYLLMFNLAGLLSSRIGDFPRTPGQLFHNMDPEGCSKAEDIASRLRLKDQYIDAFGISGCMIGRNGFALVGDEVVGVWAMRTQGQSFFAIADYLWEARAQALVG
ncbi:hypothetical protein ATG98_3550 [Marinobacter sp. LV10R520-4]|nr:hypothetical protein ATG98_3550 [Marinobacter sp. LV10R520-4]